MCSPEYKIQNDFNKGSMMSIKCGDEASYIMKYLLIRYVFLTDKQDKLFMKGSHVLA